MSTRQIGGDWDDARERRREEAARYLATLFVSILVHVLLFLLVVLLGMRTPEAVEEDVEVPIVFEEALEPEPAPVEEPAPQPEPEPEQEEPEKAPEEEPLLGFNSSEGEIEAVPTRPQGPEEELKAPPAPLEEDAPEEIRPVEPEPELEAEDDPQDAPEELEVPDEGEPSEALEPQDAPPLPEELPRVPAQRPEEGDQSETPLENERALRPGGEPLPFPPIPERPQPRRPTRRPDERRRVPDFDMDVSGGLWADNIKFDSTDYKWDTYSTKLYFAVYRAWLRELLGRVRRFERDQILNDLSRIEGEVKIRFRILRDGSVQDVSVLDASVIPTLDEASGAAVQRAVIPPLPGDFPRESEGVTFRFRMSGFETASQIERRLKYLQYIGEF